MLYHLLSHITQLSTHFLRKHFNILHSSNRSKDVFKQLPSVAYRRSSNLRDLLVKAQFPVICTNHFPPGSFRCGQNFATCPYITNGLTSYTFYATGETRSITSHITCNTKNVIYMVQCNRCNLQYIGETKRRLKDIFSEHRRTVDKTKPTTVSEHFLSHSNHSHTVEPRLTTTPFLRPLFCGPNKSPPIFLSENPVNPTTPLLRPTTTFGSPESLFSL